MKQRRKWASVVFVTFVLGGCGSAGIGAEASGATSGGQDYGATKQMVIDILHSSEGKTALQDIMKDPSFKQQLVVSKEDISKAVTASIESKKTQSFLSEQAKDPKFASALATAVQPEMIQTMKQMLKDPDAQKDLLVLMKSPDFTKHLQEQFQTPQFRQDIMTVMMQSMDNPSFQLKFQDALKKAVTEAMKSGGGKSSGSKSGGSGENGGGESGSSGEGGS